MLSITHNFVFGLKTIQSAASFEVRKLQLILATRDATEHGLYIEENCISRCASSHGINLRTARVRRRRRYRNSAGGSHWRSKLRKGTATYSLCSSSNIAMLTRYFDLQSSVLESICSLPLPRGAGLTTRCAIELRLTDSLAQNQQEWRATIATSRKPKPISVSTMEELESAIAERAKELVDPRRNGGFSRERIIVEISSPGAPNLTLIDLPGIIRTETTGYVFNYSMGQYI